MALFQGRIVVAVDAWAPFLTDAAQLRALVVAAGEGAARHFLDFFTASIRNPRTRRAYAR